MYEEIIAEIERRIEETKSMKPAFDQFWAGQVSAFKGAIKIIESLPKPSEDLDFQVFAKEMTSLFALPQERTENTEDDPLNWEYEIAKHFTQWQKEQMMKDAVEFVVSNVGFLPMGNILTDRGIYAGDKVKIIIVKEDKK